MKTKDLIKQLQAIDSTGELEVVSGQCDIHFANLEPAYYDGKLVTLIRDKSKEPYYDVVGIKVSSIGNKINLHLMGPEDVIVDDWTAKIDLSDCHMNFDVSAMRQEGYKLGIELDHYPCESCEHKPIDFHYIYEKCFDCQPSNSFKEYIKLEGGNGQNSMS